MMTLKKLLCLSVVACSLSFGLTGCGNDNGSTSGNNDNNIVGDTANNVGDAAEDLAEGAGDMASDAANGIGNAVDDLVGTNGFDNYDDARQYFLDTMENYHSDAKFEVRDEDRDLEDYQEGSKGYRFELYDTSSNEHGTLFGEFYVDANTGVIYQELEDDKIVEYRGTSTDDNTANNSRTGNNANGQNSENDTTNGNGSNGANTDNGNNGNAAGGNSNTGNTDGGNGNNGNTNGGNASTAR